MSHAKKAGLAFLALLLLANVAGAAGLHFFADPIQACEKTPRVQAQLDRLEREGFVLRDEQVTPCYYFVEPEGDYYWGEMTWTLVKTYPDSIRVDQCEVTAEVTAGDKGYFVSKITIVEYSYL